MSATYCLLVGLSGPERIAVLDALDVPELAQNRRTIEPTDRLVIVARDVASEAGGVVASSWRRLGRTVDVIPPEVARVWRPTAPRAAFVPRLPPVKAWDYTHADAVWYRKHRGETQRVCDICGDVIGGKYGMHAPGLWAHHRCSVAATGDLEMLARIRESGMREPDGMAHGAEGARRRLARLLLGGMVRAEMIEGVRTYYRAQTPTLGG